MAGYAGQHSFWVLTHALVHLWTFQEVRRKLPGNERMESPPQLCMHTHVRTRTRTHTEGYNLWKWATKGYASEKRLGTTAIDQYTELKSHMKISCSFGRLFLFSEGCTDIKTLENSAQIFLLLLLYYYVTIKLQIHLPCLVSYLCKCIYICPVVLLNYFSQLIIILCCIIMSNMAI